MSTPGDGRPASRHTGGGGRSGPPPAARRGPLGALPGLSPSARRALQGCGALSVLAAVAVLVQAWALAAAVAGVVTGSGLPPWALPVLAGAVVARALLSWATQVVAVRAAAGAKAELRALVLDRALAAGPEWIAERGAGELTALATRGLDALDDYFAVYLPALVTAVAAPLGVGAVILFVDWPSAVVVALTVPLIPLFAIVIGRYTEDRVGPAAAALERLSGYLVELVGALPVLAAFRRAEAQARTVREVSEAHRKRSLGVLRVAFSSAFALELVATLSVALVAVVIGLRLVAGDLSLAVGLFVLVVVPECYLPLRAAGAAHHASEDGLEAVRRVAAVPEVPRAGGVAVADFAELRVTGLRVRRREGFAPDGVTLTVRPGEVVRLDSPSGSGKSTLFGVLLGFVAPTGGSVEVDGVPLGELDVEAWRRLVGWVPQRPVFASDVVDVPAEWAREVGIAHALGRPVAELSTGERQRVAVARALARPGVRLLVLDEPTAHLDAAAAAYVMGAVRRAAERGVAVLLATHRVADGEAAAEPGAAVAPAVEGVADRLPLRSLVTRRLVGGALLGAAALVCGVALTALSGWLIARASQQPPILVLSVAVVGVRFFGLARAGLRYLERLVSHDAAFRIATGLRVRLWTDLVRLGPARTLGLRRGEGVRRLVDDVDAVRDLGLRVLVPPIVAGCVAVAAVAVQAAVLPGAGLALALAVAVAALAGPAVAVLAERRASRALAAGKRRIAVGTQTLFTAAAELLAFGEAQQRRAAIAVADRALVAAARRQAFGAGAGQAVITLALGAATVVGVALAAVSGIDPVLVPIVGLIPLALAEALVPLTTAAVNLAPLRAAHARTALPAPEPTDRSVTPGPGIRLDGVTARWPGAAEPALENVDLAIRAGQRVAVVGPSGAGKSTLVALLLGFLDAERGTVRRPDAVAWCPQEPMLVSTTLRENLRLADPGATDAQLRAALAKVRLHLPLDTTATTLSGGEAQRVALARALLTGADLLLLDEPTAHLDRENAEHVRAAVAAHPGTVVHITHHPEEAAAADVVLAVSHGRVRVVDPVSA
ncbi:thiol reductant ABC exporter subunit CydC [Actinokineospora spheciospongiae]|uniref:thiol reductant ABC exporter subunit CydC n=1 Tax=Actinokineospora spheciospongiae TaxID=909613 RepID=UPI000D710DA3|nr:thiol reductant ABC exporter subunit CydC [Actinokineospora spheciospongiae]PWW62064.1 ATP-binding cassette subfamily C protein CydCD [Actinokineospora spheciospongiae]